MFKTLLMATTSALLLSSVSPTLAADDVVDIAAPFEITGLDPARSGDIFLRMSIVETLVEADGEGKPIPALAREWTMSEDGLIWRFSLEPGVKFHDGTALEAAAVANVLNIARGKPGLLSKAPIEAIAADGDDTVVITLTRPFTPLVAFLAESRAQILAPAAYQGADVKSIIGTGPYKLTSLEAPQKLAVERVADYWGEEPAIEKATYLSVGRAETRALMAESGDADYVFNLDPASRTRLSKSGKVELLSVSIPRSVLIKVNAGHDFLKDVKARQALSLAIDREGLAAAILRYPASATQLFPPSLGLWHDADLAPLAYGPEVATSLLAELGWKPGDDGILERDGKRFALTLTTYPDRPELPLIAAVLQDQLKEIGVELAINSTNSSEVPAKHQDGSLELALMARNFALVPDPIGTMLSDYGPKGGDWGAMNWSNPDFDEALDELTHITDPSAGESLRQRAVSIMQTELPVIPVAWYQQTVAVSSELEGATIDPFERSFGLKTMRWAQ
ncbi:ABC transporter substrate-binding protein [Sinorhizobium numidicum]|uniref:ABC transporter substrate-binding protein n=1 Tax=Sinorhizobium numidicum TaxID=680248 RepID=A0ABY8CRN1_9HYPH|nr:ABC transporter substrate-binding protein [Sinorhizobium numidicum]WEX74132.1 ABC transporter substrate-binding protein [Sinorhizobium numidicum]WEX80117.1 ABC transporter substrate-binding protein [Sinorhizobium numidicum]